MIIDVKVPQLSESVAEATLVSWHKKAGEAVTRDENLIDIETDKVVLELPAPDSGVLVEIVKGDGDTVVAGEVIARIDTAAQAGAVATPAAKAAPAKTASAKAETAPAGAAATAAALPAARKILEEKGIPAGEVAGTGRGQQRGRTERRALDVPRARNQFRASFLTRALPARVLYFRQTDFDHQRRRRQPHQSRRRAEPV